MWCQGVGWQDHSMCWGRTIFLPGGSLYALVFKTGDRATQRVCGEEVNLWSLPSSWPSCWSHTGQCGEEVGVRRAWQPQNIARAAGWSCYQAKTMWRLGKAQGWLRITMPGGLEDLGYTWCGDRFCQVQPEFCSLSSGESEKLHQHHRLSPSVACLVLCCSPSGALLLRLIQNNGK